MSLQSASMLVKLTLRQWDGFKKDKRVSDKVDEEFKTSGNAGNYNKRLLDKTVLSPIQKIANRVRFDHKFYTMPWCYDGVDLLPSKLYFEYTNVMRSHKDSFIREVENLIQQYPIHKSNQALKLGAMFNPDDYPFRDELRHRFNIEIQFFPVPEAKHFIIDLENAEAERLKDQLTISLAETQTEAMKHLYERVGGMVEHMHDRLSDPENIFRDSLVMNMDQLVEILPGLNIFDDPVLTQTCKDIREKLLFADVQRLREDPELRARVATSAYDIAARLKPKS